MPSKTYNKAIINGTTYIDLSGDTVTADNIVSGYTAHDKNGVVITGTIMDGDNLTYGEEPLVGYAVVGKNAICEEDSVE